MSSLFEETERILDNRRILSEIRQNDKIAKIHEKYPKLAEVEREISHVTGEQLLAALDGRTDYTLDDKLTELKKKKDQLIKEYGLSDEDFAVEPHCKLCGDTGYIDKEDGTSEMCECLCELLAPSYLARSGCNRYPGFSFDNANDAFFENNEAGKVAFSVVKALAEHKKLPSLIFYGASGCGKTFTAVCAARYYAEHGKTSMVIKMADAMELMMEHRKVVQAFRTDADKEKNIEMKKDYLVESDLLVLDDMGVEAKTANAEADILYILDSRLQAGKATIITTNFDIPTLKDRYGARVYDRLLKNFKGYPFSRKKAE